MTNKMVLYKISPSLLYSFLLDFYINYPLFNFFFENGTTFHLSIYYITFQFALKLHICIVFVSKKFETLFLLYFYKAELLQVGILSGTQFPSLGIFIDKKVVF